MAKHKTDSMAAKIGEAKAKLEAVLAADANDKLPEVEVVAPKTGHRIDDGVSHISTLLEFPTDQWGLTKDLKTALIAVASRVNGHPDKLELVEQTLEVLLVHLKAKYRNDALARGVAVE